MRFPQPGPPARRGRDVLEAGDDRRRRPGLGSARLQQALAAAFLVGLAVVAAGNLVSRHAAPVTPQPSPPPARYPAVLVLESPPQRGTPISGRIPMSGAPYVVLGECTGRGTLTISVNAETGFSVRCRPGRLAETELYVDAGDLVGASRGVATQAFVFAQAGNSGPDTWWRVTVRRTHGGGAT